MTRRRKWLRRAAWSAGGVAVFVALVAGVTAIVVAAGDFPSALLSRDGFESQRFTDRRGVLLRESPSSEARRAHWVALADNSPHLVRATIAAEDRRFYNHFGIDVAAIARAALANLVGSGGRQGASTITQQLVKLVRPRPRTLSTKLDEAILAMRLERQASKARILEEYLNRAPYGNQLYGVDAAARAYFGKPPALLSLGEAALLAGLPRAPSGYSPTRFKERAIARQQTILRLMEETGAITSADRTAATAEPLAIAPLERPFHAPHFVARVADEALRLGVKNTLVATTLDGRLQGEVEEIVRRTVRDLRGYSITNAAVVVLENATGDVLSYVGSADFKSVVNKGQVDGARARRQPGSTLKPFVYALAFERGTLTPASLLADLEVRYVAGGQEYAPQNFDTKFHGPVRVREALANSYNIPAVRAVERVGVPAFLSFLRSLGVASLDVDAEKVGLGAVLGNGEVTLVELTAAYAALARGGIAVDVRMIREEEHAPQRHRDRGVRGRVLSETSAALITNILSDRSARKASFGESSALDLPFRAAVKTGTSTNFRDNWTVGYTAAHTVGVWVGDFDARPLGGASGIIGAAPIWRDVMLALYAKEPPPPFADPTGVETIAVCPLSGARVGPACPGALTEHVPKGRAPQAPCAFHHRVHIDSQSGLLAASRCRGSNAALRTFESYPPEYLDWAYAAGRPIAPVRESPTCPPPSAQSATADADIAITFPLDGDRFAWLPDLAPDAQSIPLRARIDSTTASSMRIAGHRAVEFIVDGRTLPPVGPPFTATWPLARGRHTVVAKIGARTSPAITFDVR
ncbi:MAG: penicillin-binding protein 1C [Deltaproteobacteria bacterium]|nr:penicillin-binding protein 1C [Deltaproteobacteria bacterium]